MSGIKIKCCIRQCKLIRLRGKNGERKTLLPGSSPFTSKSPVLEHFPCAGSWRFAPAINATPASIKVKLRQRCRNPVYTENYMQCSKQRLLDYLVGAGEQRWWEFEMERLGGLQIDNHFVLYDADEHETNRIMITSS